jgi:hypothetical protein
VDVTDNIDAATKWTADNVYVIPSGDTVSVNAALTIEPGTVIKFESNSSLSIGTDGQINAIGSAATHIVFTGIKDDTAGGDTNADGTATNPAMGDWSDVTVAGNSSSFDYVEYRYSDAGLVLSGGKQSVKHSTFTFNAAALDASSVSDPTSTAITNNVFYKNTHPIGINGATPIDSTNSFHNPDATTEVNTFQSIDVTSNIDATVTWSNTEVAYVLGGSGVTFSVYDPAVLTLATGVVVKLGAGNKLSVASGAALAATGATFTSYKDDSKLGDSNGDGTATNAADGDWEGVDVDGNWLTTANVFFDKH